MSHQAASNTVDHEILRSDLKAMLGTRNELGPEYDATLVDGFVDRIERAVEAQVNARTGAGIRSLRVSPAAEAAPVPGFRQTALGIVSVIMGVVAAIITTTSPFVSPAGAVFILIVCWAGLVGVNLAHAIAGRLRL